MRDSRTGSLGGRSRAAAALQFRFGTGSESLLDLVREDTEPSPTGYLGDIMTAIYNPNIEHIVVNAVVGATAVKELERSFRLHGPVTFTAPPRCFERESTHIAFSNREEFDRQWPWDSHRWSLHRRQWVPAGKERLADSPTGPMYVVERHVAPPDVQDSMPFVQSIEGLFDSEGFRMAGVIIFYVNNVRPWLGHLPSSGVFSACSYDPTTSAWGRRRKWRGWQIRGRSTTHGISCT